MPRPPIAPSDPGLSSRERWLLAALVAAACALYFGTLNRQGFWFDELRSVEATRLGFAEMLTHRLGGAHPPLFFVLSWLLVRLAGENEIVLRLLPAASGVASVALLFLLGRRLAGTFAGTIAASLLLISPIQIEISQMARDYAPSEAFLLGAILCLVGARSEGWKPAATFGLLLTLAAWTHYSALPVLGSLLVVLVGLRRWRFAAAAGTALALAVPFLLATSRLTTFESRVAWVGREATKSWPSIFAYSFADLWGSPLGSSWLLAVAVLVIALAGFGAWALSRRGLPLLGVWLGPPLLTGVATLAGGPPLYQIGRYLALTWAIGITLTAIGITALATRRRVVAFSVLGLLAAVALLHTGKYLLTGSHWPAREVAEIVAARRLDSEILLLHGGSRRDFVVLNYYWRDRIFDPLGRDQSELRLRQSGVSPSLGAVSPWDTATGVWLYVRPGTRGDAETRRAIRAIRRRFRGSEYVPVTTGRLVHLFRSDRGSRR